MLADLQRWPVGLPYEALRESYKLPNLGRPLMKSPMASGKIRYRRTATLRISTMAVAIDFTAAQLMLFHAFVNVTLGDGSAEFIMPVWIAAARQFQDRIVTIVGGCEGIAEQEFAADLTLVSFSLDVRNL